MFTGIHIGPKLIQLFEEGLGINIEKSLVEVSVNEIVDVIINTNMNNQKNFRSPSFDIVLIIFLNVCVDILYKAATITSTKNKANKIQ